MSLDVASGNGKRIRSKGTNARNVVIISGLKKNDDFEVIEKNKDYSWEGRSLRNMGLSLSTKLTASGFQKKLMRYSKRFKEINIFEIFDIPAPDVVCMDEFQGSWLGKDTIYWLAKDPFTAVGVAWLLTTGPSFLEAISLESKVTQNCRSNPKIWIHDGKIDYPSGLVSKYSEEIVRRVYLNRKFEGSVSKIVDKNTYLIQKQYEHLVVEKGYSNPLEFMEIDDLSSFTPTIKIILDLFNNHNARAVFILNEEKFIPFKVFAKKFLALTKDDGMIYDFILWAQIGTVIHGLKVWLNWPKEETNGTINALPV